MSDARAHDVGGVRLPRPFKIDRLGHVGLYHEDLDAAGRFFGETLGFRRTDVLGPTQAHPTPRGHFFTHCTDHHSLVLLTAQVARSRDDGYERGLTTNQLSFQVGTLREVVDAHRMFRDLGTTIWRVGRDRPGSNWAVYFLDPDGHKLELFYGMEQIGWDGRSKSMDAWEHLRRTSEPTLPQPAEADEIAAAEREGHPLHDGHSARDLVGGRYDVGGVLLPRPFRVVGHGPVDLFVRDVEASTRFYVDRLGLIPTEESLVDGHRCVFLRAGREHHSIGLMPIELRARLGLPERTTLMSLGVRVGGWTQLRGAVAFMRERGHAQLELPAGLHPGIDYAAHFSGPEGHCIRLYFEMECIGWDGRPRPAHLRRRPEVPWPETIDGLPDTYADRCFMGPLG